MRRTDAASQERYRVPCPVFDGLVCMRQGQDKEENSECDGCSEIGNVLPEVSAFVGFECRHDQIAAVQALTRSD
jgi:hypothetical protein